MLVKLCQVNPTVGDLKGNLALLKGEINSAVQENADVIVFPELVTTGYPPRDLLYKDEIWTNHAKLIADLELFIKRIQRRVTVIFGGLHQVELTHGRYARYNAGFVIDNYSKRTRITHKRLLPCYDVFDESRYFRAAEADEPYAPIVVKTENGGEAICDLLICEDIWNFRNSCDTPWLPSSYNIDPVSQLDENSGPLFVINGSPFWEHKYETCRKLVESICHKLNRAVVYVNQVGAHDDIVTHGGSIVSIPPTTRFTNAAENHVWSRSAKMFATDSMIVQLGDTRTNGDNLHPGVSQSIFPQKPNSMPQNVLWYGKKVEPQDFDIWCDFHALKLHVSDYCRRTGFREVVLGLSGGIDSAVVACIAADALHGENVHGVTMPSEFSSKGSWTDAEQLAKSLRLGTFQNIPIKSIHHEVRSSLLSGGKQKFLVPVTEENIQPRARGMILMGLSNDNNWLLLTTGNKSEIAVGYCTLYGDMCGGLAVISDVPKTRIYEMARCINKYAGREVIPEATITKPPSAELAPDQLDSNSLPPYEHLDPLLEMIYEDRPIEEIMKKSKIPNRVTEIVRRVQINEFKRRQMADGPKIRQRSFGSGRRMPVACKVSFV